MIPAGDGPSFGLLSRPYPAAVAGFLRPAPELAPLIEPAISHGLTDAGQATRFVQRHGGQFRYDHSRRAWFRWADHFWTLDRDGEVKRAAIELARDLYLEASLETNLRGREAIARFAIAQQARRKSEDVLELAKVIAPIADSGMNWNADAFALVTRWGVVDLRTGRCRDGCPEDGNTSAAGAKVDPTAKCPRWLAFLNEIFDDPELVRYIQRAIGYSATGDMREQAIFVCHGSGANGKSTFLDTIAAVLGEYAYASPFQTFEAGQRSEIGADVAALAGRRFVTSSETNSRARFNEARLKALSGGDRMNARHLYGNLFEFYPICKVWLGVNHRPSVDDDSYGFWRRMHLIPFTKTFAGKQDDKTLKTALWAEASGILNWVVEGTRLWMEEGLVAPPVVIDSSADYRRENDPLSDFLAEFCVLGADLRTPAAALFLAYDSWAQDAHAAGHDRLGRKAFGSAITKRFESKRTEGGKVYLGIGLRHRSNG